MADLARFGADPGPTFYINADPNPTFYLDADPDTNFTWNVKNCTTFYSHYSNVILLDYLLFMHCI